MCPSDSNRDSLTVNDILLQGATTGIKLQRDDGSFSPGRNYTYDEPETPVPITCLWLRTFTKAYKITGNSEFERAANLAVDYLIEDERRPSGFTFHCRKAESKNKCNGLVGQAGPIWALTRAAETFDRQEARDIAEDVFELHPFNDQLGLWEIIEIDGSKQSFDRTLNHQIIFAAAAANLVPESGIAERRIRQFLNNLKTNMQLHFDGLIKHYVRPPVMDMLREVARAPRRRYNMLINEALYHYYSYSKKRKKKERGYQTVNLEALSRLRLVFKNHEFWDSTRLSDCLEYLRDNEQELVAGINTRHGHLLPGISIAKIYDCFCDCPIKSQKRLILSDIDIDDYDGKSVFELDDVDVNTQAALVCRLTTLPDIKLDDRENKTLQKSRRNE